MGENFRWAKNYLWLVIGLVLYIVLFPEISDRSLDRLAGGLLKGS
jgi:hypothetical protein